MKPSDFNYPLPEDLIARYPLDDRAASRMMVLAKAKNGAEGTVAHKRFRDLSDYLRRGDVLILNDTRVMAARLRGRKSTGGAVELLLVRQLEGSKDKELWLVMSGTSKPMKAGVEVFFESARESARGDANELKAVAIEKSTKDSDAGLWIFELIGADVKAARERLGELPLPPYLKREAEDSDKVSYQTVFSVGEAKAVAAPTAGLHFTYEVIEALKAKGTSVEYITLHTGPGTFLPVRVSDIATHKVPAEYYRIDEGVAKKLRETKAAGGRIVAVGTTVTRALEAAFSHDEIVLEGMTDIFIYPPFDFKVVDALLTNFHLPESSLLMLVSAFAGRELIMKAYKEAVNVRYRFFSYGACMLIL